MKHTRSSRADIHTPDSNRKPVEKSEVRPSRYNKQLMSLIGLVGLALIVTVYVLAHRGNSSRTDTKDAQPLANEKAPEVEVLDGAGTMKAAQHITNILRLHGYDVVEMKRSSEGIVDRSFVMDRSGNLDAARTLAEKIGISQDKVFQKIDKRLYLDMTVMVGKDFSQLKAFQAFIERSKR